MKVVLDEEAVHHTVRQLAEAAVNAVDRSKPTYLVPVLNAAIPLVTDFMRAWHAFTSMDGQTPELHLTPARVQSYVNNKQQPRPIVQLIADYPYQKAAAGLVNTIVVDTVVDTGRTLSALLPHLAGVNFIGAVIIKVDKLEMPVKEVWSPHHVSGDPWLVGYGLDDNGTRRELPYIAELDSSDLE